MSARRLLPPAATVLCVLTACAATEEPGTGVVDRARAAGARVVTAPAEQPWGYAATFADPDGHLWMITAS